MVMAFCNRERCSLEKSSVRRGKEGYGSVNMVVNGKGGVRRGKEGYGV